MELKIFKKKHVSFQEMLVFLIKFIFYFDTTELYTKTNNKLFRKNGKDTLSLFDYCFYGDSNLDKIINIINCQSGGSEKSLLAGGEEKGTAGEAAQGKEAGEAGKPAQGKETGGEAEEEEEAAAEKPGTEPEAKAEVADIGVMDFINELKDGIVKGINLIKTKLLAILTLILYASIFPAIPFFLVMTSMYATLKYIMFKFRNF